MIESPVCTPIGSKFSIEQMITTLSARSRITSNSNSFQPRIDSSIRTSCIGDAARPARNDLFKLFRVVSSAAACSAESERRTNDCRISGGCRRSARLRPMSCAKPPRGIGSPASSIACLNSLPIFGDLDCFAFRANHLHAVFVEDARHLPERSPDSKRSGHRPSAATRPAFRGE